MKAPTAFLVFVLLSFAAYAQDKAHATKELKPMKKKKLELRLPAREATAGRGQFKKPSDSLTLRQKPASSATAAGATAQKAAGSGRMPVLRPDATVLFPVLAAAPDSTVRFHLQVKKP